MPDIFFTFRKSISFILICGVATTLGSAVVLATPDKESWLFPDPLSLQQALNLASSTYPDIVIARSMLEKASARQALFEAENNVKINLDLTPQKIKLTTNGNIIGDSYASLNIRKKLYDFGYTDSLGAARSTEINQYQHQLTQSNLEYQFEIVQSFYNVILADLRYTFENEEMSQLYVKFDRLNERHALGMVADVDMLDAKNQYREQLNIRTASEHQRRISRQRLALKLNRPDQLPGNLIMPKFTHKPITIPDVSQLYVTATRSNPGILALRENVKTMQKEQSAQKARYNPSLSAIIDLNEYERALRSRADIRVGLQLNVPIYLGGKKQANNRLAYVEYLNSQQKLRQAEFTLREQLLVLTSRLQTLKIEQQTAIERMSFRDQVLDKQRALYELELQASMGSTMANLTRAEWQAVRVQFEITLTQIQIDALLGKSYLSKLNEKMP